MEELFHLIIDSERTKDPQVVETLRKKLKKVLQKYNVERLKSVSKKREQYCNTVNAQVHVLIFTKLIGIIVHVFMPE